MKELNSIVRSVIILAFAFTLIQCDKDEDTKPNSNSIKMDGEAFAVVSASMLGVSIEDNGHTGITFFTGTESEGRSLTIDVESFTQASIEGEYAYPAESDKKLLDEWLTHYTVYEGSAMESSNLESGQVEIVHNGEDNYTVEMDLIMDDGVTFKGTYSGDFFIMFYNE